MAEYNSPHTGEQFDEAVSRSIRGGEIDKTHVIKTYGSLAEIGLSSGIETMARVAQSLVDNSRVTYSAAGGNDVADGSAYPVKNGSAVRNGVLTAHRVNANHVFFEYANSENVWVGFYDGSWSGWAQVYDTKNKPSAADVGALPIDGSGTMTGNLVMSKAGSPQIKMTNATTGRILYLLNSESTGAMYFYNQLDSNNYHILRVNPETDGLKDALKLVRRVGGTTETHTVLHTGNTTALGIGGGLTPLKTLTVPVNDVNELEFQLTAAELSQYKRFVIFPKLASEYVDSSSSHLYLEAPTFSSSGVAVNVGALSGLCSVGVAFISVGAEENGWSIRMMAINGLSGGVNTGVESAGAFSSSSYQNPTTAPITFRLYTTSSNPFVKGGTVSIMGVK